ncbi:hypothetical protein CEXT_26231 [Caerostris extrusa]|uniref:Uncharacterized protein n=1 Tax=Caerostris extrusa TaxID=172846 RepID=A0AAV4W9V7_CAEEX|nr:hypothetical protein CEXT_26231 [Caerostris extrusa]
MESSSSLNANSGNHRFNGLSKHGGLETFMALKGEFSSIATARAIKTNQDLLPSTPYWPALLQRLLGNPSNPQWVPQVIQAPLRADLPPKLCPRRPRPQIMP